VQEFYNIYDKEEITKKDIMTISCSVYPKERIESDLLVQQEDLSNWMLKTYF
jgi:hypothetical protein